MRDLLATTDEALLERVYQPVADFLSKRALAGNARGAVTCMDAALAIRFATAAEFFLRYHPTAARVWDHAVPLAVLVPPMVFYRWLMARRARAVACGLEAGVPIADAHRPERIVFVFVMSFNVSAFAVAGHLSQLADALGFALWTSAAYLSSTRSLPPAQRREALAWTVG
jgi:hypothetical protein